MPKTTCETELQTGRQRLAQISNAFASLIQVAYLLSAIVRLLFTSLWNDSIIGFNIDLRVFLTIFGFSSPLAASCCNSCCFKVADLDDGQILIDIGDDAGAKLTVLFCVDARWELEPKAR